MYRRNNYKSRFVVKVLSMALLCGSSFIVGYSRIYLQDHSVIQVLAGISCGFILGGSWCLLESKVLCLLTPYIIAIAKKFRVKLYVNIINFIVIA